MRFSHRSPSNIRLAAIDAKDRADRRKRTVRPAPSRSTGGLTPKSIDVYLERPKPVLEPAVPDRHPPRLLEQHLPLGEARRQAAEFRLDRLPFTLTRQKVDLAA